jgi:hypothetical protein
MIDAPRAGEWSATVVAEKVAEYLKECHPGGVTLEVDPDGVVKGEFEWRVRVRPSHEPPKPMEYYEALTDIEMELEEREHLNVFLVPSDPKYPQASETEPQGDENRARPNRSAAKPKRRLKGTKQVVAQKVAEYLRDCHPGGITLEADAQRIRKEDYWWEVPVRPDVEPWKLSEYYEALAAVEAALEEREHLKVFLAPSPSRDEPLSFPSDSGAVKQFMFLTGGSTIWCGLLWREGTTSGRNHGPTGICFTAPSSLG